MTKCTANNNKRKNNNTDTPDWSQKNSWIRCELCADACGAC